MKETIKHLIHVWGGDAGHSGWAVVLTVVAWALLPEHPYVAAAIGCNVYAIPKETIDGRKRVKKGQPFFVPDMFSDYMSYQVGWPLVVTLHEGLAFGAPVFGGIAVAYIALVWAKRR